MANTNDDSNSRMHHYHYATTVATNHRYRPRNYVDTFQHPYYNHVVSNIPRISLNHGYPGDLDKKKHQDYRYFRPRSSNPSNEHPYLSETATRHSGVPCYNEGFQFPYESRQMNQPTPDICYCMPFQAGADLDTSESCQHPSPPYPPPDQFSYLMPPSLDHASTHHSRPTIVPNQASRSGRVKNITPGVSSSLSSSTSSSAPTPSSSLIGDLQENDIVCSRGAPTLFHKGNQKFRNLVLQYQNMYMFSKRKEKPTLTWNVLEIVTSYGGRFVRRNKAIHCNTNITDGKRTKKPSFFAWEQLNKRQAYEKICQSLRESAPELRRRMLQRTQEEESQQRNVDVGSKREDGTRNESQTKKAGTRMSQKGNDVDENFDED